MIEEVRRGVHPCKQQKKYETDLAAWEKAAEAAKKDGKTPPAKPKPPLKPGEVSAEDRHLYEAHIRPMIPFGIRGVLWDQGESGTAIQGIDQFTLMGALIRGWRNEWGQGEFPFIYVQKPSGGGCAFNPEDPITNKANKFTPLPPAVPNTQLGLYRETHIRIAQYPQTAMVVCTDLGSGIHPTNKSGYGSRASRVALGMVYGKKVEILWAGLCQSTRSRGAKSGSVSLHIGQGWRSSTARSCKVSPSPGKTRSSTGPTR